jgi:hypothetical protein
MTEVVRRNDIDMAMLEQVVVGGNLKDLTPAQRLDYYRNVCESVGLNPLTRPFDYIVLTGKLTLYAKKDATDQLRKIHGISISKPDMQYVDDVIMVAVTATDRSGRSDADVGVVTVGGLKGDAKANAIMKAITKAKRRVTLSMAGLGWLDETELDTIPTAEPVMVDVSTGEILMTQQNGPQRAQNQQSSNHAVIQPKAAQRLVYDDKRLNENQIELDILGNRLYGEKWLDVLAHNIKRLTGKQQPASALTDEQVAKMVGGLKELDKRRNPPPPSPNPVPEDVNYYDSGEEWRGMSEEADANERKAKATSGPFVWPTDFDTLEVCSGLVNAEVSEETLSILEKFITCHTSSLPKLMSDKQYGFLTSLIDKRYDGGHNAILSALCGRVVNNENIPGWKVKELIDWLKDAENHGEDLDDLDEMVEALMADLQQLEVA